MSVIPNEIIPYAFVFIFLIFLLALKKTKSSSKLSNVEKKLEVFDDEKKIILEAAEQKLLALKDLYLQELIDVKVYVKKTELVASNLSNEMGENMMEIHELQKKIVYNDLKKEIKKKIDFQNTTKSKTNIDNLILAVDKKIKTGEMHEEK
tara:strand:+ start:6 stop:455 length:450 start_codon:yes stop_codon:yes gene_type:complete